MKKLFCICILACLLLTSCGGGGEDLNVYTTEPRPETSAPQSSDTPSSDSETNFVVKTHDIPEELREYVPNYTYEPSDDDSTSITCRYISSIAIQDDYMYYVSQISSNKNDKMYVIKRLNLKTGEISSPCFDPVCTHDTLDCNFCFYNVFSIQAFGRYIVYYAGGRGDPTQGYLYDAVTGEVHSKIFNAEEALKLSTWVGCIGDSMYSSVTVQTDNPHSTGSHDKTIYDNQTWEYHVPTKTSRLVLSIKNTANVGGFKAVYDGRIYYTDEYNQYCSMLPDGSDVREEPYFEMCGFYEGQWMYASYDNSIHAVNMTNGQRSIITPKSENLMKYRVTSKYIYYCYNITSQDESGKETTVAEMWRCDHAGQNAQKMLTLNNKMASLFMVHGNYLYFKRVEGESQKARFVRIHVETGEILYIE